MAPGQIRKSEYVIHAKRDALHKQNNSVTVLFIRYLLAHFKSYFLHCVHFGNRRYLYRNVILLSTFEFFLSLYLSVTRYSCVG